MTAGRRRPAAAALRPCPATAPGVRARAGGLPDLTLDCVGAGPPVTLSALRGRPLLVNVWASWCAPCEEEMPVLARAEAALGNRVQFLGVLLEDDRALGLAAARDAGVRFPSVSDGDGRTRRPLRLVGPPTTLLVAPDGQVRHVKLGPVRSVEEVRTLVAEHLGVS